MRRDSCVATCAGLLVATLASAPVHAGPWSFTLRADAEPQTMSWDEGASFSWEEVDGNSTAFADMQLEWSRAFFAATDQSARRTDLGLGAYWHRSTDETFPVNDRGVSGGLGWLIPLVGSGAGPVRSLTFFVEGRAGLKLVPATAPGSAAYADDPAQRMIAGGKYSHVFAVQGSPTESRPRPRWNLAAHGRVYWDRVGGDGAIQRSVSGVEVGGRLDIAPIGIDPERVRVGKGSLGFVPALAVFATYQNDMGASSNWSEDDRSLIGASLRLSFRRLMSEGFIPAIVAEYSDGADLLIGRADTQVTRVAFALKY